MFLCTNTTNVVRSTLITFHFCSKQQLLISNEICDISLLLHNHNNHKCNPQVLMKFTQLKQVFTSKKYNIMCVLYVSFSSLLYLFLLLFMLPAYNFLLLAQGISYTSGFSTFIQIFCYLVTRKEKIRRLSSLQQHHNIKFTKEIEENNILPTIPGDVLVTQKIYKNGFHHMTRKPTYTNNLTSHHHPVQLNEVLRTIVHRTFLLKTNRMRMKRWPD